MRTPFEKFGLDPTEYGTYSMQRTYVRTKNAASPVSRWTTPWKSLSRPRSDRGDLPAAQPSKQTRSARRFCRRRARPEGQLPSGLDLELPAINGRL